MQMLGGVSRTKSDLESGLASSQPHEMDHYRATYTDCSDGSMTVCFMPMGGPINYCTGEKLIATAVAVAP